MDDRRPDLKGKATLVYVNTEAPTVEEVRKKLDPQMRVVFESVLNTLVAHGIESDKQLGQLLSRMAGMATQGKLVMPPVTENWVSADSILKINRGWRIRVKGTDATGTILGLRGGVARVRFDGDSTVGMGAAFSLDKLEVQL